MTCGIYYLSFEKDTSNKKYIGQSIDIHSRYLAHCGMLKLNTHHNYKLYGAYLKYGLPSEYVLEEVVDLSLMNSREVFWVQQLDTYNNGMNLTKGGDVGGYGEKALYSEETYAEILTELAYTDKGPAEISLELGIPLYIIDNISNGSSHKYLSQIFPKIYELTRSKVGTRISGRKPSKTYPKVISPEGVVYEVTSPTIFAKEHKLNRSNLSNLVNYAQSSHKGWKVYNE